MKGHPPSVWSPEYGRAVQWSLDKCLEPDREEELECTNAESKNRAVCRWAAERVFHL